MTILDRPLPALLPSTRADVEGIELPQHVASRALAQAATLLTWGWLVTAPVVVLLGPDSYDVPSFLLVLGSMAALAGVGSVIALRRPEALTAVAGFGVMVAAGGIVSFDLLTATEGAPANPAVSLMGTTSLVAGLVLRLRPALLAALALAVWHSAWDLGPPQTALSGYLEMLLTAAGTVVAGRFVARSLVRSAVQVSELVTRFLDEQRTEQARRVRESSVVAARTDLHDTVLTTLSGIGAGWLQAADPAALRDELRRDVRLLSEMDELPADDAVDLAAALRQLATASLFDGLHVSVLAEPGCRRPAVVADPLLLATREALVNVVKHAAVDRAVVTLEESRGTVRITVTDEGTGFDTSRPAVGLGLRGVDVRLNEIGGWVTVASTPGAGTTVSLVLPGEGSASAARMPQLWSEEGPRLGAIGLTVVAGVSQLLSFFLQAGGYADLRPQLLALALALGVDVVLVATLVIRRRMPKWLSAVLIARIAAVLLTTGLPLSGCEPMGYAHFSGGGEFFTVIVIALLRPAREAVAAATVFVACWAVLAAPLYAAGWSCGITGVANSAIALGLTAAALTFVAALRRHANIAAQVLAAEERLIAARTAQQVRADERRRLLRVVGGLVTDTLAGLADGRLDPRDTEVRERCRRDARLLRTFLHQAGDADELNTALFERSVRLRSSGVDLAVRGTLPRDTVAHAPRQVLLGVVDTCLEAAPAAGWSGEALVTVLRTGTDVLATLVLSAVPDGLDVTALLAELPRHDIDVRAEIADHDLWVTCTIATDGPPPTGDAP